MSEDKTPMTPEEEDLNAGVERDEKGQVVSEATNEDIYFITLNRNEHHQVTSSFKYVIPIDDILEEFGSMETFRKAVEQKYGDDDYDSSLNEKFNEFYENYDYDRDDDWWTDRKGGYEVDYEIE